MRIVREYRVDTVTMAVFNDEQFDDPNRRWMIRRLTGFDDDFFDDLPVSTMDDSTISIAMIDQFRRLATFDDKFYITWLT